MDSGASIHVTNDLNDFADYKPIQNAPTIRTASKGSTLSMKGIGTVFISHWVTGANGRLEEQTTRLFPVFHVPNLDRRLLSMGEFLQRPGNYVRGDAKKLGIYSTAHREVLACTPNVPGQTIYWAKTRVRNAANFVGSLSVYSVDYELMHRRFGHVSKQVLEKAKGNTQSFPSDLNIPSKIPICRGCAQGKMTSQQFP